MKTTKLSHLLFSIAVIAALVFGAFPMAPAYAMSSAPSTHTTSLSATGDDSPVLASGVVVCRSITFWRNGHRITVRVCHRVHRHDA
jgi:hypothetical protein